MLKPLVVAHCGDSQNAPENTLPAFESAIVNGADTIEFDVHLTKDGELVVHHDYYLGRSDNGSGFIGDYTLVELQALDAGSWFDGRFTHEKVPALREVLELGKSRVRFEIDLRTPRLVFLKRAIGEIADAGVADEVELTSTHVPLLLHVRRLAPELRTGVFFESYPEWMLPSLGQQQIVEWLQLLDAQVAHLPLSTIEPDFVRLLHNEGYLIHASNVNTEATLEQAITIGTDQISTDHVSLAVRLRNSRLQAG